MPVMLELSMRADVLLSATLIDTDPAIAAALLWSAEALIAAPMATASCSPPLSAETETSCAPVMVEPLT